MLEQSQARPIYVLLVEDDRDDFFLTQDALEQVSEKKYAVVWAGTYDRARTALFEQEFDVALVDYHIGDRTGLEFISEMGGRYPSCPMILLTGVDNPDVDRAAEQAGAADFLVKDALTPDLLDRTIRYARKNAERKALLSAVLENAGAGMIALDPDGKAVIWNRRALRALDLAETSAQRVRAADVDAALASLSTEGGLPEEYTTSQAEAFEIGINGVPGGGKVVVFQDVTRRARTEQLLRQTAADAETANRAKSTFLATMSHELRTPLNGILGMVRVLETAIADPTQISYVETIKSSSMSLLAIINDVLDLSKIEAGKFELDNTEFELTPLLDEVVRLLAPGAFDKGIDLAVFAAPDLPGTIRGDAVRLRQIVTNLVGNAVKFTTEGSVIVQAVIDPKDASRIRIDVIDSGIGITPENREKLFQKFSQVDSSLARRSGGTGLGLALCRELLTLMGGSIWCQSELGRGSTFSLSLPRGAGEASAKSAVRDRSSQLAGARVALLSQSTAARRILASYFDLAGGKLILAKDEAELLQVVRTGSIDAVIFDRFGGAMPSAALQRLPRTLQPGQALRFIFLCEDQLEGSANGYRILARPMISKTIQSIAEIVTPRSERKAAAPVSRPAAGKPKRLRILMAEDNEPNRRVAAALLRSSAYHLEMVTNGLEAITAAQTGNFDVVLMDVNMPVLDGLEATRQLRGIEVTRNLPIIGLTANAMTADRQNCLLAGMTEHVAKPIDWDALLALLARLEGEIYGASSAA
jgi:signal transduction histidine kinase